MKNRAPVYIKDEPLIKSSGGAGGVSAVKREIQRVKKRGDKIREDWREYSIEGGDIGNCGEGEFFLS